MCLHNVAFTTVTLFRAIIRERHCTGKSDCHLTSAYCWPVCVCESGSDSENTRVSTLVHRFKCRQSAISLWPLMLCTAWHLLQQRANPTVLTFLTYVSPSKEIEKHKPLECGYFQPQQRSGWRVNSKVEYPIVCCIFLNIISRQNHWLWQNLWWSISFAQECCKQHLCNVTRPPTATLFASDNYYKGFRLVSSSDRI